MRRLAALLPLLIALAAPAAAQTPAPKAPPVAVKVAPKRLQSPMPTSPTADQCRASCAQTYYFCLAGSEAQDCSPQWAQCRVSCGSANALPR